MQWAMQQNWHNKLLICTTAHICVSSVESADQEVFGVRLHTKALQAFTDLQAQEWMMTTLPYSEEQVCARKHYAGHCSVVALMGDSCMQQRSSGSTCTRVYMANAGNIEDQLCV